MSYQYFENTLIFKYIVATPHYSIRAFNLDIYVQRTYTILLIMKYTDAKIEFYRLMEKFYLNKPVKKPYNMSEKVKSIL